ncbi:CBS domain-containing protein [Candidatus Sumerlaeota bacterium]|nr:CBS domain-containing protein [Candidatus Sumerlaeota bacterium]
MRVKDILRTKGSRIITIDPEATLKRAIFELNAHKIGSLMVLDENGRPLGIITERDILHEAVREPQEMTELLVRDVMTKDLICAVPDDSVEYVMGVMTRNKIRHLPIVENRQIAGLLSIGDVIKSLLEDVSTENKYLRDYITQSI